MATEVKRSQTHHFKVQHFIDGQFVDGGPRFPIIYPATGEEIGTAPAGGQAEVDAAVAAARRAFGVWGKMKPSERRQASAICARSASAP